MIDVSNNFRFAAVNGTTNSKIRIIVFDDPQYTITNSEIVSESMKLSQSICDDTKFTFGGCIASQFEIEIAKDKDITGKYITVVIEQTAKSVLYPGENIFPGADIYPKGIYSTQSFAVFSGEVYSCKLNKNRITRTLIAYDRFYWKGSIDCTKWYQAWHRANQDSNNRVKLGALRLAILKKFRIIQAENNSCEELVPLPADNFPVYMIEDNVTVSDLLRWICEFNGCFMFFNGNGNVEYIFTNDDKYTNGAESETYNFYMDVETEDYSKSAFDGLYISGFESGCGIFDIGTGEQENLYFMDGNTLLTTGYTPQIFALHFVDLPKDEIDKNFAVSYTPMTLTSQTRLWVQVGDRVNVKIKWYDLDGEKQETTVTSIVLSRNISGIQAMKDEISADGENMRYTEEYFDGN